MIYALLHEPTPHVIYKIRRIISKSYTKGHEKERNHLKTLAFANLQKVINNVKQQHQHTLVSIVMPTYNSEPKLLVKAINSVMAQVYDKWELCIYDDGSTIQETIDVLRKFSIKDTRISVEFGTQNNGIAYATNAAIKQAKGEYIGFLDHDDMLHINCLLYVQNAIQKHQNLSVIYTDEVSIDMDDHVTELYEKVPFGMNTFRSLNYLNHFTVVKKKIGDQLQWLDTKFEGAQDYDLLLRILENVNHDSVIHISEPLYYWRQTQSSISKNYWIKPIVGKSALDALNRHYYRTKTPLKANTGKKIGTFIAQPSIPIHVSVTIRCNFGGPANVAKKSVQSILKSIKNTGHKIDVHDELREILDTKLRKTITEHNQNSTLNIDNQLIKYNNFICYVNAPILIHDQNWLNQLISIKIIPGNEIVSPTLLSTKKSILSRGFIHLQKTSVNLDHNENKGIFKNRFSGIILDVQSIYNICYLCTLDSSNYHSIVTTPSAQVQLIGDSKVLTKLSVSRT